MTDGHRRALETLARHSQRRLEQQDAAPAAVSGPRGHELQARAARTRARVAAARARRRQAAGARS